MEAFHKIKVNSPYEILEIEAIKISNKPNEHGMLYLKVLVDENINFKYAVEASTDDKICIYEETENEEKIIIFNGTIQNIKTSNENRLYYMEIEAYASSFAFDIEEKSRSFQDSEMSYDDLINTILLDYKIYSFTQCMDRPMSIGKPLFQYKETDYEFLRRVASHLGLEINSDIINTDNGFYFGRPSGRSYEIEEDIDYTASMDIKKYKQSLVHNSDIHPTDFFYYEIKTPIVMEIGAKVVFRQKELYVYSYEAEYVRGDLIFTYRLCRQKGIWQEKLYNDKLKGISLEGRVMEVSGEQVKLHLNIDETQNQAKAAWFRYAPPTGNLMYSMPIVGTNANLYFPSERSEEPMVIGCVRKNGGSCEKCSNVNNRYFSTESGNNLDMLPDAINFSRPGLSANFNDGSGITLSSSSSLSINAGYVGMFAGNVSIEGITKIVAEKGESSSISLENDFYNSASIVMENGSDRASNEPFDDDPQNGVAEAKAAMEAVAQAAIGALAAAMQGAMGNVANCLLGNNSTTNNTSKTKDVRLGASPSSSDDNDSVPTFSESNQYFEGERVKINGYNGKVYYGTAEYDGYVGVGSARKFKFVPDDPQEYNKDNEDYINQRRTNTLKFLDNIADGISKYTYIEQKHEDNPHSIIENENFKLGVDVLSGQGWAGLKVNILDDDGNYSPQAKLGLKLEGKLITFPYEFKSIKLAREEYQVDGELNLMAFEAQASVNSGNDDFEEEINAVKLGLGIMGSFAEGKIDAHYKSNSEDNTGIKCEITGNIGSLGADGEISNNKIKGKAADVIGGGYEISIENKDGDDK